MSYTKTTWNDLTGPAIDATNLNKIEQGIYDNSIDITSINTLIGSSGTATTTQTDFTEGQLTQKLGLKYIKMKGQTSQASDPTPTNPVDVNVVTGTNTIKISNKNIIKISNGTTTVNNLTAVVDNGQITLNGTPSYTTFIDFAFSYKFKANQTYMLSLNNNTIVGNTVRFRLNNSGSVVKDFYFSAINQTNSFSFTEDTTIDTITIRCGTDYSPSNFIFKPQIEIGSTATSFIAHREEDYNIDLPVENEVDLADFSTTAVGITIVKSGDIFRINGTATANNTFKFIPPRTITLSGDYTLSIQDVKGTKSGTANFNIRDITSDSSLLSSTLTTSSTSNTATLNNSVKFGMYITSGATFNNYEFKAQLERGTKVHQFTPYGTTPIELSKIGNYQDYIYKNNGKWYKHCEVGKKILNGTETWNSMGWTDRYAYRVAITDMKQTTANSDSCSAISNYYKAFSQNDLFNVSNTYGIANRTNTNELILRNDDCTTGTALTTALSTNNVTIYYQKATPIEEEITYEPLLRQLDKLDKIGLYDISNISQDNSDMKMLLDFTICNDNYNGLREFIRA